MSGWLITHFLIESLAVFPSIRPLAVELDLQQSGCMITSDRLWKGQISLPCRSTNETQMTRFTDTWIKFILTSRFRSKPDLWNSFVGNDAPLGFYTVNDHHSAEFSQNPKVKGVSRLPLSSNCSRSLLASAAQKNESLAQPRATSHPARGSCLYKTKSKCGGTREKVEAPYLITERFNSFR